MRPCIDHRIGNVVVRQMRVVLMSVESELENTGSGDSKLIAQRLHLWRDQTQVFSDERQTSQLFFDCSEKQCARARNPLSRLSSRRPERYIPRRGESPEVVHANHVDMIQERPDSIDTPSKTG